MEYEIAILGLFIFVVLLMVFHRRIEKIISSKEQHQEYAYAHSLIMEKGEILSRPPSERYPDMEENQKMVKLYYERSKNAPVHIYNEMGEKVKPILISVK